MTEGADERGRPYRVCHVIAGAMGGVWMVEQLRELRQRHGYEVHAIIGDREGPLVDLLRREQIPFHVASFLTSPQLYGAGVRAMLDLARYLRRQRFDVVQSHVYFTIITARPAAWIAGVPVRLFMVPGPFHLEAETARALDRSTLWMESAVIPSCQMSQDLYREMSVADERAPLVYYGADVRKFDAAGTPAAGIRAEYGWPDDTPVIALVAWFYGRCSPLWWVPSFLYDLAYKGQEDFVMAASLVREAFPSAKFLLVGGPFSEHGAAYMEDVRTLIRDMGLEEHVILTGHRGDVNRLLRDVDVAVQASLTENPGGTIEGLLMEAPMVATRVGGMLDTVRDGVTGVLVNPDDPRDLARGIVELLRDPARARALGRQGRRYMLERFSLDRTADDLHALYARLLAARRGQRRATGPLAFVARAAVACVMSACDKGRLALSTWLTTRRLARRPAALVSELRRWNGPGDIVAIDSLVKMRIAGEVPADGLFLGRGWYRLERDHGQPYRWLESGGLVVITRPRGPGRLVLLAESGPGQDYRPFTLTLVDDERGSEIGRATVAERGDVAFHLPLRPGETATLRLTAPAGVPFATDPRILNLRVFRLTWDPS